MKFSAMNAQEKNTILTGLGLIMIISIIKEKNHKTVQGKGDRK